MTADRRGRNPDLRDRPGSHSAALGLSTPDPSAPVPITSFPRVLWSTAQIQDGILSASESGAQPGLVAVARGAEPWRHPLRNCVTVKHIMFSLLTLSESKHLEDKKPLIFIGYICDDHHPW